MTVLSMRQVRRAFTLVELLVVVSIIGVLAALLLPALSSARASANLAASSNNLSTFGRGFSQYSTDNDGVFSTGAFDPIRDGDVREIGWVADLVKLKVSNPGKALDLGSRNKYNEKVADYVDASKNKNGGIESPYWIERGLVGSKVVGLTGMGIDAAQAREMIPVYNSNYATTWHFSRGDPTATNSYAPGTKQPLAGDGPLTANHIAQGRAPAARIAMMGPARAGDGGDALVVVSGAGVIQSTFNTFAGKTLVKVGDLLVESFNDGMEVSAQQAGISANSSEMIHQFNDIEPVHQAKNADGSGGVAPILFADGSVAKIVDTVTAGNSTARKGDQFLGNSVSRTNGAVTGFVIDNPSYNELADQVWLKRLRVMQTAGGSKTEDAY